LQAELGLDEEMRFARFFRNLQLSANNLNFALSNLQQTTCNKQLFRSSAKIENR
jgi:hypothetical protein